MSKPIVFEGIDESTLHRLYEQNKEPLDIVSTPIPKWNRMSRDRGGGKGLAYGWHVTYGAKSGSGKSVFGLNMATHAAMRETKVGYLSLEMSFEQLLTRALSIASQVAIEKLEVGDQYSPEAFMDAAQDWENRLSNMLHVNRDPIATLDDIRQSMHVLYEEEGVRFFIIDYLQLAWVSDASTILKQITEVSHKIRDISHRHNLLTLGLSQITREASRDTQNAPRPVDLYGGAPLENDSDQVVLADHTTYKDRGFGNATQMLVLGKNRHGPKGKIAIGWDWKCLRAYELADDEATALYKEDDDDDGSGKVPF